MAAAERARVDRALSQRQQAVWDDALINRDQFLGIASHDLRGLLGGIVNAAAILTWPASRPGHWLFSPPSPTQPYC